MDKIQSNIPDPKRVLEFQLERSIKSLFKSYLVLLEDLAAEHEEAFRKLKKAMPKEISLINQADYFSDAKQEYIRKKILSAGNDAIRALKTDLELFDIGFSGKE